MLEQYCFYDEAAPEWGIDAITIAQDREGALYFPVKAITDALALDRGAAVAFIKADSRTAGGVRAIRVPTRGGRQEMPCIRRRELAIWLAVLDPRRIGPRAKAAGHLQEFQASLWHLAERIAFRGKASADAAAVPVPVAATLEGAQRALTSCPDCGSPLVAEVRDGKVYLWHAGVGVN